MHSSGQKLAFLYKPYALAIVSVGYVLGELGHYLIGKPRSLLVSTSPALIPGNTPKSSSSFHQSWIFRIRHLANGRFVCQGVTSKEIAEDLHYGDISCQFNSTTLSLVDLPVQCEAAKNSSR